MLYLLLPSSSWESLGELTGAAEPFEIILGSVSRAAISEPDTGRALRLPPE